jgi:hypothetical protein
MILPTVEKTMMTELTKIAKAIEALAEEHGAPNNFTASEISDYARVPRIRIGLVLRDNIKFGVVSEEVTRYRLKSYGSHTDGYSYASIDPLSQNNIPSTSTGTEARSRD